MTLTKTSFKKSLMICMRSSEKKEKIILTCKLL